MHKNLKRPKQKNETQKMKKKRVIYACGMKLEK